MWSSRFDLWIKPLNRFRNRNHHHVSFLLPLLPVSPDMWGGCLVKIITADRVLRHHLWVTWCFLSLTFSSHHKRAAFIWSSVQFRESWTAEEMKLWALHSWHPVTSRALPRRCQQCPESTAARNECTPICNDWVITLFAVSTLFWRSGRPHLCSVSNCQAGAASASSICILHWGVALQMIMLNCFCNRNVQSNKVNDLERHGGRRGGGRKLNRLKCRCSPSDGGHDGGVVSM